MKITVGEALLISLLGFAVVFLVLILLMFIIRLMSAALNSKKHTPAPAAPAPAVVSTAPAPARGSCGEVKLFDVPDRTAAMVMAIVADKTGLPLNELRFISIKEAEDNAK